MTRTRLFLQLFAFLLISLTLSSGRGEALQILTGKGNELYVEAQSGGTATSISYDWKAQVKIGQLMGEPVVSAHFLYDIHDSSVLAIPYLTKDGGKSFQNVGIEELPEDIRKKVELYDVKLQLVFGGYGELEHYYLVTDVGLPGPSGQWSFNVPGSPNWGKLFLYGDYRPDNRRYLDAETAKKKVKKGLSLVQVRLIEEHFSLYDVYDWYESVNPDYYIGVYKAAIQRIEEGLRLSYGIKTETEDQPGFHLSDRLNAVAFYKHRYEKLKAIPDSFRIGNNEGPYLVARSQARQILASASSRRPRFKNDQVQLPGDRKEGYPLKVGGGTAQEFTGRSKLYYFMSVVNDKDTYYLKLEFRCKEPYDTTTKSVKYISYTREGVPSAGKKGYIAGTEVTYGPYAGGTMDFSIIGGDLRLLGPIKPILKDFYEKIQRMDPRCKLTPYRAQATIRQSPGSEVLDYCHDHIDKGDDGQQSICVKSDVPLQFSP